MVDGTEGTTLGKDGEVSERREPPTIVVGRPAATDAASEPPTRPIAHAQDPEPVTGDDQTGHDSPAPPERTEPVWPGLTAAGLPTRVPRQGDEETIKEAFAQSWEASPTGQTPLTRKPFTPTYLSEPPRPRRAWSEFDPTELLTPPASEPPVAEPAAAEPTLLGPPAPVTPAPAVPTSVPAPSGSTPEPKEPPDPKEPPEPAEPPQPHQPPEPKQPPRPPAPPGPSPFPAPTPVPTPPEPMPPSPVPSPVPPRPPSPPVPSPPPPFPPPPGPVPPPPTVPVPPPAAPAPPTVPKVTTPPPAPAPVPVIVPGPPTRTTGATRAPAPRPVIGTSTYQGGAYTELTTEPITGVTGPVVPVPMEMSGSLTGHLLSRNQEQYRRRERRRKVRTAMWVTAGLAIFAAAIAVIVNMLAGDFIRSIFATFSDWAG